MKLKEIVTNNTNIKVYSIEGTALSQISTESAGQLPKEYPSKYNNWFCDGTFSSAPPIKL